MEPARCKPGSRHGRSDVAHGFGHHSTVYTPALGEDPVGSGDDQVGDPPVKRRVIVAHPSLLLPVLEPDRVNRKQTLTPLLIPPHPQTLVCKLLLK